MFPLLRALVTLTCVRWWRTFPRFMRIIGLFAMVRSWWRPVVIRWCRRFTVVVGRKASTFISFVPGRARRRSTPRKRTPFLPTQSGRPLLIGKSITLIRRRCGTRLLFRVTNTRWCHWRRPIDVRVDGYIIRLPKRWRKVIVPLWNKKSTLKCRKHK